MIVLHYTKRCHGQGPAKSIIVSSAIAVGKECMV